MAFFDKLKGAAKKAKSEVKSKGLLNATITAAARVAFGPPDPSSPTYNMELVDEATLDYAHCDEFELEELDNEPGSYKIIRYIGFGLGANIEIPGIIDGNNIVALDDGLFKDVKELRYVKLGEGIKSIGKDTFRNCSIRGILLPDSLERIGACAFTGSLLMRVSLPDNVQFIGRKCFEKCEHLQFAKLPKNKETLPDFLFFGCQKLKEAVLPENLTYVGHNAYVPCNTIPATLETIGDNGLVNLAYVDELIIPNTLKNIGGSAFKNLNCGKLIIPVGLNIIGYEDADLQDIDEEEYPELFEEKNNQESSLVNGGIISFAYASVREIVFQTGCTYPLYNGPFRGCRALEKLYIPKSMSEFGEHDGLFGSLSTHDHHYEAVKDEYGRQVYDWDGSAMKTRTCTITETHLNPPPNPNFVLYCEGGSVIHKFAQDSGIPCAKWDL